MCSCTDTKPVAQPTNQQEDGLILARALYTPQRAVGPVSGRKYPRTGLGYEVWVDPRDAEARPEMWEIIPIIETPSVDDVRSMALRAIHG